MHAPAGMYHVIADGGSQVSFNRVGSTPWVCRAGNPGMGRKIALDVARGLTFLHTNRIAHMDLKTPNGAPCSCLLLLVGHILTSVPRAGLPADALQRCARSGW